MIPLYEDREVEFEIFHKKAVHVRPHLHRALEFVLVTDGNLEIGQGRELFHMETGDFAIIFPDMIHHYQVFGRGKNRAFFMLADVSLTGSFQTLVQQYAPTSPVISSQNLHEDVRYAIQSLRKEHLLERAEERRRKNRMNASGSLQMKENAVSTEYGNAVKKSLIELIMARCLPVLSLEEKGTVGAQDLIFQVVYYIASHFREPITLGSMAHDLGCSPYALSRIFSSSFHRNFNQYLNENRLDYAESLLRYSDQTITDICFNSGFDSQRTFNRVFQERYHMSPRDYRKEYQESQNPEISQSVSS